MIESISDGSGVGFGLIEEAVIKGELRSEKGREQENDASLTGAGKIEKKVI